MNRIIPKQMEKSFTNTFENESVNISTEYESFEEEVKNYHSKNLIDKKIKELRKEMELVAKKLDFIKAADLRDKIEYLNKLK